jgi:hypothetical protein
VSGLALCFGECTIKELSQISAVYTISADCEKLNGQIAGGGEAVITSINPDPIYA